MLRAGALWLSLVLPGVSAAQDPSASTRAPAAWSVAAFAGTAWNARTRLVIRQEGSADLAFTARYATRAFEPPFYYAVRIGRWRGGGGWDLELLHHKIYLQDPPPEVGRFEVTHGYNLLTFQRGWGGTAGRVRVGAGVVVGHAASEIRGRYQDGGGNLFGGYHLAGPVLQVGAGRTWGLTGPLAALLESRATAAWAEVPVAGGSATVPNVALHLLGGVGWTLRGGP
jgi:hypothetical protein